MTGIPFTDSFRLKEVCGLEIPGLTTFETSSVFVYDMIKAYGGAESFYLDYFISAVCPLGFVRMNDKGREVNYNYYDDPLVQKPCCLSSSVPSKNNSVSALTGSVVIAWEK